MIDFCNFNSLFSVVSYFCTEERCQQAIVESRWGDDVVCPYCGKYLCHKEQMVDGVVQNATKTLVRR